MKSFISKSEASTYDFAFEMAKSARECEIITLKGDLGAGKTVFCKGYAAGLGIREEILSPTFTIMNVYEGDKLTLCHVDAYRLKSGEEAYSTGLCDYLGAFGVVSIVEWADNIKSVLPSDVTRIEIDYIDEKTREIKVYDK